MVALDVLDLVQPRPDTSRVLPFEQYDKIIVCMSGGKDSLAAALHLLDLGVDRKKLEWWHQHVDGSPGAGGLMDWPITQDYCRKLAQAFGIPLYFQWREGGFEREMLRNQQETACVRFEMPGGTLGCAGGKSGRYGTRLKFPQQSADLKVRWCSAALKIDVASVAINNDPRFRNANILLITGERREESPARSKYAKVERHRTTSKKWRRRCDQYRIVIDWTEQAVWDTIKKHRAVPHPAYRLGFSRVSCLCCIFGNADQWATVRLIAPDQFERISAYEKRFGLTIRRGRDVEAQATLGRPFATAADGELIGLAMSRVYSAPVIVPDGQEWVLPRGAIKRQNGPS